jgi:uncharacterized protein YecE (DUF72 family)
MGGQIRIGVSGWRYTPWRGNFYPKGLAQSRELHYASRVFNSIELNGSFYSLQWPTSYSQWADQTPEGFVFAVKGSRYITHMLKLRSIETALANFIASGLFELGDKLGPILWQFPPMMRFHPEVFEEFFSVLPRSTGEAMWIACAHDERPKGRVCLEPLDDVPLRHCVEVRHESFETPEFIAMLRRHNIAWVVADTPRPWPLYEDVTADFIYMRLHGSTELYNSRYSTEELVRWAALMRAWANGDDPDGARRISPERAPKVAGRDVYCYFDNTDKLHAPDNAQELMELLGLRVPWQGADAPAQTTAAEPRPAAGSLHSR